MASGSLWDQERDEISVRVLLEEGKLNLALRILQQYMEVALNPDQLLATAKVFIFHFHLSKKITFFAFFTAFPLIVFNFASLKVGVENNLQFLLLSRLFPLNICCFAFCENDV
jgi:hypothetical protein